MKNHSNRPYAACAGCKTINYAAMSARERATVVKSGTLGYVMRRTIRQFDVVGRARMKEIYLSTLKSFLAFRNGNDVYLDDINADMIMQYEKYLHTSRGVSRNTSSFYMRVLRAVYNRAVGEGLATDCRPFKHVYTGVDKTLKRALPLSVIKKILQLDLSHRPKVAFARDLFMFSFYTRGMSFVDMAYLRKNDLKNGVLTYRRRKTGQVLHIKWEKCMQEFIAKHGSGTGGYLLPIIKAGNFDERSQYQRAICLTNLYLKEVGQMVGLSVPLTTYVARHSWANIAKYKNVPLPVISEGMGHESEKTTRIYLASFEHSVVDKANSVVIKALFG